MNFEAIKQLAIEWNVYEYTNDDDLAAYTAAVEARERERCAVLCEGMYGALRGECAAAIRSL